MIKFSLAVVRSSVLALLVMQSSLAIAQGFVAPQTMLRGEFKQIKTIKSLKKPVLSSGNFVIAPGKGMIWDTRSPSSLSLTILADGKILKNGAAQKQNSRAQAMVGNLTSALITADEKALSQQFTIKRSGDGADWSMLLTPKNAALARAFTHISINGNRYVESIAMHEKNGNLTELKFLTITESNTGLSPEEAKRFP